MRTGIKRKNPVKAIQQLPVAERRKKIALGASRGLNEQNKPSPDGAKAVCSGCFSVAPAGAWMVLMTRPTVLPWAIICRASGASFAKTGAQIFFQPGEGASEGVRGFARSRDYCGLPDSSRLAI